jgi:hypothetical protein
MLDLIAFCRREGEERTFTLDKAGRVTVLRTA